MHIAQVSEWGQPPKYVEVANPPVPAADSNLVQIKVQAAGLHSVVRSRAGGLHYSAKTLPHFPGTDGVGTTSDGRLVYFSSFATGETLSEYINVPKAATFPLPPGVDPLQVAAFGNPAASSWMALKACTSDLPANFTALVMGATSASGSMAISMARQLGAGRVIGVARNTAALAKLGLDETIELRNTVSETDFSKLGDVDVVLDYLYGPPTEHLFKSLNSSRPVQYVQIGSLAGLDISLPSQILRSKNITLRGSGPGSWSLDAMAGQVPNMLSAFEKFKPSNLKVVPLSEVEKTWNEKSGLRTVFVMN